MTSWAKRSQTSTPASVYSFMTLQIATAARRYGARQRNREGRGASRLTLLVVLIRETPPAAGRHDCGLEDAAGQDLVFAVRELAAVKELARLRLGVPALRRSLVPDRRLNLLDRRRRAATRACVIQVE